MADFEFYIDIENSAGQRQGSGPITSASQWRYTARMDKAGNFDFVMPASDPKAILVQKKRIARAYARINGAWTEVGAGIIDRIEKQPQADGSVVLRVSGDDLVRELTYRSVLNLKLYNDGLAVSHSVALAATGAYAPSGWTFAPDSSPPNDSVYGYFNGETVLAAMVKIADKSQNHFYRGVGRSLVFASSFAPSGVRAIQAHGDLASETCAIVNLTEQIDTYDLITRIYPRGSGNANVQLTLRATDRSAPSGYTLNTSQNYIENDTATANYGRIERQIDFRDIGPIANTDADIEAASNMLFDAALEYLKRNSTELEQATYTLQVAGCSQLLRPMQSIKVVYRDLTAGLDINTDLNILEATWQVSTDGVYTTDLIVSNADRWPSSDVSTIVDSIAEGHVYQALPQLNANSYVTAYTKNVDENNMAAFRFRFGPEIVNLQQVLFEFQILPFESTVRSVASDSPTTSSGGGTTATSSSGGSQTATSASGGGQTVASASGGSQTPTSSSGGGATVASASGGSVNTTSGGGGGTTVSSAGGGSSTPTTSGGGSATPTTSDGGGTTATSSSGGGQTPTSSAGGGTTVSSEAGGSQTPTSSNGGSATVTSSAGGNDVVTVPAGAEAFGDTVPFPYVFSSGTQIVNPITGDHVHSVPADHDHQIDLSDHTHTVEIDDHTHTVSISNHTHTVSISAHTHDVTLSNHTHTVSVAAHTHTVALLDHNHTVSISAHTHTVTISNHTHNVTLSNHNHTVSISAHTHDVTLPNHTHTVTISAHTHDVTISSHTHTVSISAHTHTVMIDAHTHTVSPIISTVYGIFRADTEDTYELADLDYRINSGSWLNIEDDAIDAGGGWWQLDITSLIINAVTFRPLAANNLLEIRSLTTGKTATIDAQLSVRNTIQAIAYV